MKLTANKALRLAEEGKWSLAWGVAQEDEGLLPGITVNQWIQWAIKTIENRRLEKVGPSFVLD